MTVYQAGSIVPLRVLVTDTTGTPANAGALTFTVTPPTGAPYTSSTITPNPTGTYDLDYDVTLRAAGQTGRYSWKAVATGTNAGEFDGWFIVQAAPSVNPPWCPALDQVADYLPQRTLSYLTPGTESYLGTFTTDTTPTGVQAARLVDTACTSVVATCGIIDPTLYDEARNASACMAAALIDLAYPEREPAVNAYDRLKSLADEKIATLRDNNLAKTGIPVDQTQTLYPQYVMPEPVPWGDRLNY